MMERSGGLNPRAVAGKLSVTKFTHSSCTGIKASGMPKRTVKKILPSPLGHESSYVTQRIAYLTTSPILEDTVRQLHQQPK
jgi:hypothetical protein